ncbi:PAS domain-containing protein [Cyanobacterium aponinum]|uniref:Two component response regulator sensor histidine kinase/response regulator subunits n=1 Tax=Cyanobacterium aponinum (strain PCC 10605) TaxID=755178 RepID=K9Z411_CYAAP|nr:PAS domain-containing protein [Cyanobacterium aponinum]AFZ53482.1 two component response regulator sensor histidine kinase/response regulator subunits [Cyanobacterium aponinum PCC 10605]
MAILFGVLTICKDISEQKAIEFALRTSEARWQFALDGASHGVWDVNLVTNETYYSPKFMEMLGYELGEWGNSFDDWHKYRYNRSHPHGAGIA